MTKVEAAMLVGVLVQLFPYSKVTLECSELYEDQILELDYLRAKDAVSKLIKKSKFFPTVAEFYEEYERAVSVPRRTAIEAYEDLNKAVRAFGRYQAPDFDDPVVAQVVRSLGWQNVCDSTNEESLRSVFLKGYADVRDREIEAKRLGYSILPEPRRTPLRLIQGGVGEPITQEQAATLAEALADQWKFV